MNRNTLYRLAAIGMLLGIAVHRVATARQTPAVAAYHARVRAAVSASPIQVSGWVGRDVDVPTQALAVLAPNAIESRRYTDIATGTWAGFMLVHCRDAHDMAGHFPLRCYPAVGWTCTAARRRELRVNALTLDVMEYHFRRGDTVGGVPSREIVVVNFLMRPGGQVFCDMDAMAHAMIGVGGQSQGAGQVQIYFDAATPPDERDAATDRLLAAHSVAFETILAPLADG